MADLRNIEKDTVKNSNYRHVVYTNKNFQLVLMSLKPGETIPRETHEKTTQFIRVEKGSGKAIVGGKEYKLKEHFSLTIPPGLEHFIINEGGTEKSSKEDLRFYTIYTPPEHRPKRLNKRQPKTST